MDWLSFEDFQRAQTDAIAQTQANIKRWKKEARAAVARGEYRDAKRLERLIELS